MNFRQTMLHGIILVFLKKNWGKKNMHGRMLNIFPKILKINGHLTHSFR